MACRQPQPVPHGLPNSLGLFLGKANIVAGQEAEPIVSPDVCLRTTSHDQLINAALLFHKTDVLSLQVLDNLPYLLLPLPTIWTLPGHDLV